MAELPNTLAKKEEELLNTLAKLGSDQLNDDGITHEGRKIILPETMSKKDAVKAIIRNIEAEEETVNFSKTFRFRPWDLAAAFERTVRKYFGMMTQIPQATMFGQVPPKMITINVGVDETIQVPWGNLELPVFPGTVIQLGATDDYDFGLVGVLVFEGPRKWRAHVEGLFKLVEKELNENSIYRGKAFDGRDQPNFLDLRGVDDNNVVYSQEIRNQLNANVWSLVEHTEATLAAGLPLKRAVLLEGPYGTGKTLAAFLTAQRCVNNDWTFIYCRPAEDNIHTVMQTARMYQPAVVFFEDMDEVSDASATDDGQMTRLLDTFDGIAAKNTNIMVLLTTNHPERIHKGMLRPGRLDAVISIGALDAEGVATLIRATVPKEMLGTVDVNAVFAEMSEFMPAFVKEAVDRAKRYAITRAGTAEGLTLNTEDFVGAARGLKPQLELMNGARSHEKGDRFERVFGHMVEDQIREHIQERVLNPVERS